MQVFSFKSIIRFSSFVALYMLQSQQSAFAQNMQNMQNTQNPTSAAATTNVLNIYTSREPALIQPLLSVFSKQTGIKTNVLFLKDGLVERLKLEKGQKSADVVISNDVLQLASLADEQLLAPLNSKILKDNIPNTFKSEKNDWFALSIRARVLYAEKDLPLQNINYEDLAKPIYKNKICIRSGQHPYNVALISAMIAKKGAQYTENWLQGVKNNLARKPSGGDRDVARDILGGICDIGLANSYYVGQMRTAKVDSDFYKWGHAIKVVLPRFEKGGTHVNVSGAAVLKASINNENGQKLIEFLSSKPAQNMYAQLNFEYPIHKDVPASKEVMAFGALQKDDILLKDLVKNRKLASELVDKTRFDY